MRTSNHAVLAVLTHPNDASFGIGGTLVLYARPGYDVYLVGATRGEVGTVDPEYMRNFHSIAQLREVELRCAAKHLGLKGAFCLGYRNLACLAPSTTNNRTLR